MKKIFITIPWFTPAFRAGGMIQAVKLMLDQHRLEYSFYVFTSGKDITGETLDVKKDCWINVAGVKIYYCSAINKFRILRSEVKMIRPDILFITGIYDLHFNILPYLLLRKIRTVVSVSGMLLPGALSQKAFKKKLYMPLLRKKALRNNLFFHATDDNEANEIERHLPGADVSVAGLYLWKCEATSLLHKNSGELTLVSICLISPMKNVLLVINSLYKTTSRIQYRIYGDIKDDTYFRMCREAAEGLPANISVSFEGALHPQDRSRVLTNAHVFILPSKSENFGHSIGEALSAGLPVITSRFTPWDDLAEHQAGVNVVLTEDSISAAVDFFAHMSEVTISDWRKGAAKYLSGQLNEEVIKKQYSELFK